MEILISIRNVYGCDKIYPANDAARTLARIAGTKTLSADNLACARSLGHVVECTADSRHEELAKTLVGGAFNFHPKTGAL